MSNVDKAFLCASIGGLLFGYIIGINSNVITSGQLLCADALDDSAVSLLQVSVNGKILGIHVEKVAPQVGSWTSVGYNQCYNLDDWSKGLLSSTSLIGATMASMFCLRYADLMGRRYELQIAAVLYLCGSLAAACAPCLLVIFLGLLVYGFGVGFAMHAAPMYIAEMCPENIRGMLVALKEVMIVLGMLLGFVVGFLFSEVEAGGWRFMMGLASILAAVMWLGVSWIPDSPRWLALQGLAEPALASLAFFREDKSPKEVEDEMKKICAATDGISATAGWTDAFKCPRPLIIGCGLVFLQQITGQPSVLLFATNIFKSTGLGGSASLSAVGIGVVKLAATLVAVFRVDSFGRRALLFCGISMMTVSLVVMSVSARSSTCALPGVTLHSCPQSHIQMPRTQGMVMVVALMVYVTGYQIGFGPVSWIIISEIFPLQVRGAAISVAAMVNFGSNILMAATQPTLLTALMPSGLFGAYALMSIASIFFVWRVVPETRGKTLEEITQDLNLGKSM